LQSNKKSPVVLPGTTEEFLSAGKMPLWAVSPNRSSFSLTRRWNRVRWYLRVRYRLFKPSHDVSITLRQRPVSLW